MSKDIPVINPLGPGRPILPGDTLAIDAVVEDGRLVARRVREIYAIIGPVSSVLDDTAIVMGSPVHVPPDTTLTIGHWFAFSGLWSGEKVITTKQRRVNGGFALLTGVVDDDLTIIGASTMFGAHRPADGFGNDLWTMSGTAEATGLRVHLISKGVFGASTNLVLWQGYASLPLASQTYKIHGSGIIGFARDAQMPKAGALIARCAYEDRVLNVVPEGLAEAFEALGCAIHIPAD